MLAGQTIANSCELRRGQRGQHVGKARIR